MTISAPFRYARINRKVWFPKWAPLVSHDVPFADGLCGTIDIEIETKTPLLIGGKHEDGTPGTVHPFIDGKGNWAIPGTSIQGMIRQILEVAAFGKLGPTVSDRRFGVRDISRGVTAAQLYRKRMTTGDGRSDPITPLVQTAWLVKRDGTARLITCDHGRATFEDIAHNRYRDDRKKQGELSDLLARTGIYEALTSEERRLNQTQQERLKADRELASKNADMRYAALIGERSIDDALSISVEQEQADHRDGTDNWPHSPGLIHYKRFRRSAAPNPIAATVVLTGKPVAGNGQRRKHREFLFYGPDRKAARDHDPDVDIPAEVWRDFLLIHEPEKGSGGAINPNWAFWKDEFQAGRPVPVFYIEEGGVVSALGMAQMFKLAMQLSTHEMLNNSSADHLDRHQFDLPSLIFGATGDKNAKDSWFAHNLKRRAAFDLFRAVDPPQNQAAAERHDDWQVLLSPKPSYYPIYVRQNGRPNDTRPYAAYHSMPPPNANPELSGTKIWPVRGKAQPQADVPARRNEIRNVANHLRSVPEKQTFAGSLRVHNLRPVELGALLWVLTYGEEGKYTHRLGGAKPLGFGEIGISIGTVSLTPNRAGDSPPDTQALIDSFVAAMDAFYGGNWQESRQIKALRKAAQAGTGALGYLDGHQGYKRARDEGQIMDGFADDGHELPLTKQQSHGPSGNKPAQPVRRNWPKEEDAPVRHKDGREGFIREIMHAACKISVDGRIEIWSDADFVVTGPPDE